MNFKPVTATMLQSECGQYQISRSPSISGRFTYRAWLRAENKILHIVHCWDESGDRAAALAECKTACETAKGSKDAERTA